MIICQPTLEKIAACNNCYERRNTHEGKNTKLFEVGVGELGPRMLLCATCLKELRLAVYPHSA